MPNTLSTRVNAQPTAPDHECRARAYAYLVELIGARPETLTWDWTHRQQGHVHVGCRVLVVIAPRDALHEPLVLTASSWDAVRRSSAGQRRERLDRCAINDHSTLVSVLESDELAMCASPVGLAA